MIKIRFLTAFLSILLAAFLLLSLVACYDEKEFVYQNDIVETSAKEQGGESVTCEKEISTYILNVNSKKIHKVTCGTGDLMLPENRKTYKGDIYDLLKDGYTKCGNCFRGEK